MFSLATSAGFPAGALMQSGPVDVLLGSWVPNTLPVGCLLGDMSRVLGDRGVASFGRNCHESFQSDVPTFPLLWLRLLLFVIIVVLLCFF